MSGPLITFTSDYGARDEFVGSVKGVILGYCPAATIIDITHEIEPQAIDDAAWRLAAVYQSFPEGTIHLAVVDPGVGGGRRAIAAQTQTARWVGPDNGLFTLVFDRDGPVSAVELDPRWARQHGEAGRHGWGRFAAAFPSTFDGRDLFAPVVARLACGNTLESFGRPIREWVRLPLPEPSWTDKAGGRLGGSVVRIDRFGNLMTNLSASHIERQFPKATPERMAVAVGGRQIRFYRCYSDAPRGTVGALINSAGYLELFCAQESAASRTEWRKGEPVRVARR